jgi:CDGSH-type Zn-finger protein/truncated hemoglobin YjbI/ferredoxin
MIVEDVLARARALAEREPEEVATRLRASVIRPLAQAGDGGTAPPDDDLWALARDTTRLRALNGASPELIEATAALQSLVPEHAAELAELQAELPEGIEVAPDGPYLATNLTTLRSWLGASLPVLPQMALCRCGASAIKPLCDGSHAETGFSGAKDPERVPDRRDTYRGQAIVYDNRGTCAHSGFCTDRVPTAFRVDAEPFVAPSGGRTDEIARAVRACPSGALAIALADREERAETDTDRPPAIEVSRDGPYRITGGIPLTEPGGAPVPRNEGASLEHYSLCRCGHSLNKPFCSGQHWRIGFRDPELSEEPTVFDWAGGLPAFTRVTRIFYERYVPEDPLLAPLFANMAPDHPERVASWLSEVFGGPKFYSEGYGGYDRMVGQHLGRGLTEEQRARWVQLIGRAADDAKLPADPEFRAAWTSYLEWGSRIAAENSQPGAHPPPHMPVPRWWWTCDATPGSRASALSPVVEEAPAPEVPGPNVRLGFEQHIKPLFRRRDRDSMRFAFDLWSHDDVAEHADAILERLAAGTMPCDGAWPPERVDAFRRWVEAGKAA